MKYLKYFFYLPIVSITAFIYTHDFHKKMIVCVPVADVRSEPKDIPSDVKLPTSNKTNPLQLTQLLFNEYVIAQKQCTDEYDQIWYFIQAVQQPIHTEKNSCTCVPGWVKAEFLYPVEQFKQHNLVITNLFTPMYDDKQKKIDTLFIGTKLTGILDSEKNMYRIVMPKQDYLWINISDATPLSKDIEFSEPELRTSIIKTAQKFLGNLYSWGGRTPQTDMYHISSVDCSGLINLIFAAHGLLIPRNSSSQYLKTTHIKNGKDLKSGDLIFFADMEDKINHVILYTGNGNILESALSLNEVKEVSFKDRIGFDINTMQSGDIFKLQMTPNPNPLSFKIYFGSFLNHESMISKLRHDMLRHNY